MTSISIIICTYNRADILSKTLESWHSVRIPKCNVELIVIDNKSTDHTFQVVASFYDSCPCKLRYVHENKIGLSNARNRGIEESNEKIVAFVDDDVDFHENWLQEILKAFYDNSDISAIGGCSIPKFEIEVPHWITEDVYKSYGSTDSGPQDRLMHFPEHPYGLNMAFRRLVFDKVGVFNPALGRVKRCLISNEEFDIFYRLKEKKLSVLYASKAIIYHRIPEERIEKKWLIERYYWQGISDVISDRILNKRTKFYYLRRVVKSLKKVIFPRGIVSPVKIVKYYLNISFQNELVTHQIIGNLKQYYIELFSF